MSSKSTSTPALFQPIKVGDVTLAHRVVLAHQTRFRADAAHVHTDLGVTFYEQRASVPGTLLITEATFISPQAGGYTNVPGIWSDEQISKWKEVRVKTHPNRRSHSPKARSQTQSTPRAPSSTSNSGPSDARLLRLS